MEGSDVFTQDAAGEDDPFAGTDLDFGAESSGEPPVVNREGERLDPAHAPNDGANAGERPQPEPPAQAAAAPAEVAQEAVPTPATPASSPPSGGSQSAPEAGEAAADPTPSSSASSPAATGDAGSAPTSPANEGPASPAVAEPPASGPEPAAAASEPDPTPAPSPEGDGSPSVSPSSTPEADRQGESGGDGEDEEAEPPAETKDKSGRVTKRRYLIFKVEGPGKLSQVYWYEKNGKLAERGVGAKRQSVCLARGTEDALKFGYAAAGAPKSGMKLVAVAALHFQVREVKPMPPEPSKQRLTIN